MAITTTIVGQESPAVPHIVIGKYVGDATAGSTIDIGFTPSAFEAMNWTDGTLMWYWTKDDTANVMTVTDTGAGVTDVAKQAIAITPTTTAHSVHGLVLPASSVVNGSGKTYYFRAYR